MRVDYGMGVEMKHVAGDQGKQTYHETATADRERSQYLEQVVKNINVLRIPGCRRSFLWEGVKLRAM
eukprot:4147289-Amphidinium_carterae.1